MSSCDHERMVLLLIDRGADINSKSNYGSTALICAAGNNHERIISPLIDRGADINCKCTFDDIILTKNNFKK
jgi:ankyrin repeat protein